MKKDCIYQENVASDNNHERIKIQLIQQMENILNH